MIDSGRREVIRKAIAFIWNDKQKKLPTHLQVECVHPELHLGEEWTLSNSFLVNEYSP